MEGSEAADVPEESRADRLAHRRNWRRRGAIGTAIVVIVGIGAVGAYALVGGDDARPTQPSGDVAAAGDTATTAKPTTTTMPTTTTTIPPVKQPADVKMPPPGNLSYGSRGALVKLYEQRMKDLHFDPGPVDGVFDQDTQYAVVAVQKYFGQGRSGVIDSGVQLALSHFQYTPAEPQSEPDRVEIDLDRQVLTAYSNWQPILITTTSTGSGEHFCGGTDGCQYAITPTGHFHFYSLYKGWDNGKLGRMWNPFYFNGGIAVHGLESVPAYPASHGCSRIPMHVADYFYTLVHTGESVFVVGTPMKAGNGYVGPIPTPPPTPPTTVPPPPPTTPTTKPTTPTTKHTPPTTAHP